MSTESAAEMGRRGRLVLLLSSTPEMLREQLSAYTEAMYSAGFSEEEVERNLDQTWLLREAMWPTPPSRPWKSMSLG